MRSVRELTVVNDIVRKYGDEPSDVTGSRSTMWLSTTGSRWWRRCGHVFNMAARLELCCCERYVECGRRDIARFHVLYVIAMAVELTSFTYSYNFIIISTRGDCNVFSSTCSLLITRSRKAFHKPVRIFVNPTELPLWLPINQSMIIQNDVTITIRSIAEIDINLNVCERDWLINWALEWALLWAALRTVRKKSTRRCQEVKWN